MNVLCSAEPCPIILDAACVFYSGGNLIYTGIVTNDNLQTALQKIDAKFQDAGIGYAFDNGIIQLAPGQPVRLGGSLIQNTTIASGGYNLTITGNLIAGAHITSGGTSSDFVKGDGSLDGTSYQPAGAYITALTGDGTATGPGTATLTLSNTGVIANTYGSASQVPVLTVDSKGRITGVTNTAINYPAQLLLFSGDVTGSGVTGANVTLTLNSVNANTYGSNTALKFAVNAKGLVTSAAPLTNLDIFTIIGYTPIADAPSNGTTYGRKNGAWTPITGGGGSGTVTSVSVTSGTGISASVTNPTTTPNITITNTAPDQTVVLNSGTGISVTGTYPNFTITATGSGGVTNVTASSPLFSSGGATPNITIQQASGVQNGYLSSGDWTTFNNKVTSLSAGTGISIGGTTTVPIVTNTAPDQIVALIAGTGIGISGSYPNFTITNSNPFTSPLTTKGDIYTRTTVDARLPVGSNGQILAANSATSTGLEWIPNTAAGLITAVASGTDTYTATITGVTSYSDGDAYLIRFTNGNTTTCTLNINSLGAKTLYRNNDGQLIGGDIISGAEMLCIYNSTLNAFQVIGVAPNTLIAYVTNDDSVTLTKGMAVYAFSGTGDRMTVKRAYNTTDATSAQTVGLVLSTSIAANQKGFIMMQGLLDGLSILPTSTWSDGDAVYLGSTPGSITNVKPSAPNHLVYLGVVTTASNGAAGRLYVRVQNGYELDEIHNVALTSPPNNNDGLFYETATSLWKNKSIATVLGYTPVTNARTLTINGTAYDLTADRSWSVGTVTSVAALTLGTSGTDLSSSVANSTTTPVITLNVPTASATNRGALSSSDWTTFNNKPSIGLVQAMTQSLQNIF